MTGLRSSEWKPPLSRSVQRIGIRVSEIAVVAIPVREQVREPGDPLAAEVVAARQTPGLGEVVVPVRALDRVGIAEYRVHDLGGWPVTHERLADPVRQAGFALQPCSLSVVTPVIDAPHAKSGLVRNSDPNT